MSFGPVSDWGLGNNGVRISINYFDGIVEQSLSGALGSSELQLIFKSLLKRDETTKEKALGDLLNLLGDLEHNRHLFEDECFALCWSQIYAKLITNESRNVRISAHTITTDFIRLLGKKSGKFLPDFVPFLLSGTYDCDSFVSKSCSKDLLKCFGGDANKVTALWKLFQSQTLRLVKEVLLVETATSLSDERYISKQDSQLKYIRIATTAIYMLNRLATQNPDDFCPENKEYYNVLSSENLWHLLSFKDIHCLKSSEALMNLFNTMWECGFLASCKPILKLISKRLFKCLGHLSTKNLISVSTLFSNILNVLSKLLDYKNGKMLSWDKASQEKIKKFLLLGPGNADPSYYTALLTLFEKNNSQLEFDYSPEWLEIWHRDLLYESQRRGLPMKCQAMSDKLWENYLTFISFAPESLREDARAASKSEILATVSEKPLPTHGITINLFAEELSFDSLETEISHLLPSGVSRKHEDRRYMNNLIVIALTKKGPDSFLNKISTLIIDSLRAHNFENTHYCYTFITKLMESSDPALLDKVVDLLKLLSENLDTANYAAASKSFTAFSHKVTVDYLKDHRTAEAFIKFLDSLLDLDISAAKKLETTNSLNASYLQRIAKDSHRFHEFQNTTLESFSLSDVQLYQSQVVNENTICELYKKASSHSQLISLCSNCKTYRPDLYEHLLLTTNIIVDILFEEFGSTSSDLRETVLRLVESHDDLAEKAALGTIACLNGSSTNPILNMQDYVVSLIAANDKVLSTLLPDNIYEALDDAVPFVSHQIATSSSLGLNVFVIPASDENLDLLLAGPAIKVAQFLDNILAQIPAHLNDEVMLYLAIMSELAADYNFFSSTPSDEYQNFKCSLFTERRYQFDAKQIIEAIVSPGKSDSRILNMLSKTDGMTPSGSLFNCRILRKLLTNAMDFASSSIFDDKCIESFIVSTVRDKTAPSSRVLQAATILSSITKFSASDALTRTRTYLASEIIGAKLPDNTEKTTTLLILLNNLLKVENYSDLAPNYQPIAPQRLKMILIEIGRWFDCDMWYDDVFSVLRLALCEFFRLLLSIPSSSSLAHSISDHSHRIVRDCIDLVSAGDVSYVSEFKISAVSLFGRLTSEKTASTLGVTIERTEDRLELFDVLIDAFLLQGDYTKPSHYSYVLYKSLAQVLQSSTNLSFSPYLEGLMESIMHSSDLNIDQTRLVVKIARDSILAEQQTLLVDFELDGNTKSDGNETDQKYQLPPGLLDKLEQDAPLEYLENENEYHFLKYLWDCYLVLTYFTDISYNLRQFYVAQLRERDLIFKLFDFIADQLDLDDKSWIPSEEFSVLTYHIGGLGSSSSRETVLQECKHLLLHLLYVLFKDMGAISSSWWLNLKDRALQTKIDRFTTAHISPILVKQELDDVNKKAKRLTDQDESLTVKVNNVTNEIKAEYLVDEQKLEIALKLPANYPLNNIEVHGVSRVGISEQKWKSWILSAQRVMVGMNGSVMDSLELFTKNVNLHFAGFEECAICYSILHAVDRKLPTKVCPTCKNRFHGACLYKWFRSSGNNTCPLCRSEIPFRR
ncbi:LAFA_0F17194g1_1 [Lachancea sp. 'fantastica']|nr:LAFA_0F17194g1_1 [Lachancea sp. 'fantastica']